jgi:hypothetical protein
MMASMADVRHSLMPPQYRRLAPLRGEFEQIGSTRGCRPICSFAGCR